MSKYDSLFLKIASDFSKMSYAKKKQVGAVIVKDNSIISDGYNGTPIGYCNECEDSEGNTLWYVLHAEANAILKTSKNNNSCKDATLYVTLSPCKECSKLIIQCGIKRVVYKEKYRDTTGVDFLGNFNVECIQMSEIYSQTGEINWDEFKKMLPENNQEDLKPFKCKKCEKTFFCKEYLGNFPLCKKHRYSFKK
jgi:dCMP deaminase